MFFGNSRTNGVRSLTDEFGIKHDGGEKPGAKSNGPNVANFNRKGTAPNQRPQSGLALFTAANQLFETPAAAGGATRLEWEPPVRANLSGMSRAFTVFRQPHFSPYKVFLRRDLQLGVMLNPKVGSSAFRAVAIEGLRNGRAKPQLGPWWPISRKRRYTTAPPADYFHAFNHAENFDFRCFVRNPYARVLSAWNDKLVKGFHSPSYPRSMVKLVPRIRRFAAEAGLPGDSGDAPIPFPTFLSYVESQPEGKRNQHWDTQRSVLWPHLIPYRQVYHMETDFVSGMADTLALLGIPADWTREKLARPTNASGAITEPVYTPELAERVHALYTPDFEEFGYDTNSWQGL